MAPRKTRECVACGATESPTWWIVTVRQVAGAAQITTRPLPYCEPCFVKAADPLGLTITAPDGSVLNGS